MTEYELGRGLLERQSIERIAGTYAQLGLVPLDDSDPQRPCFVMFDSERLTHGLEDSEFLPCAGGDGFHNGQHKYGRLVFIVDDDA